MRATATFTIDATHPSLAGHFPGAPIVPGVLLLDETMRAVERSQQRAPSHWTIGAAKFVKPVRPGESVTLEHERLPNGSIRFALSSGGRAVAHGVLRPAQDATPAEPRAAPFERGTTLRTSAAHWVRRRERGSATRAAHTRHSTRRGRSCLASVRHRCIGSWVKPSASSPLCA